jgi:tellurite resistance protein
MNPAATPPESHLARRYAVSIDSSTTTASTVITDAVSPPASEAVVRNRWFRLYPIALGLGGLGGAWRTAVGLGAPAWPAVCLTVLSFSVWLTVTGMYARHGGANPRAFGADLRNTEQGFALGYIPLIPLVLLTRVPPSPFFSALTLGLVAVWAMLTAALVAHWITTPRDRHAIHPGFSLPVVGGPFIASISLQANGWHQLAEGVFIVGVYFWLTFGTLIIGRLMTGQRLSDARFPTMATLMVPPATGGIAWFGLNDNRITTIGTGLAAVLVMMALVQLFILPDYLRRPFTISAWSFSFPLASAANTAGHWAIAAPRPGEIVLAWSTLVIATGAVGLLAVLSVRMVLRTLGVVRYRNAHPGVRSGR